MAAANSRSGKPHGRRPSARAGSTSRCDVVLDKLLPSLRSGYVDVEANQEDWGWFAWFGKNRVKLAVDIFTDEGTRDQFRIHLTSRLPRLFLGERVEDTPELEELRELVVAKLQEWSVSGLRAVHTDTKYIPER